MAPNNLLVTPPRTFKPALATAPHPGIALAILPNPYKALPTPELRPPDKALPIKALAGPAVAYAIPLKLIEFLTLGRLISGDRSPSYKAFCFRASELLPELYVNYVKSILMIIFIYCTKIYKVLYISN